MRYLFSCLALILFSVSFAQKASTTAYSGSLRPSGNLPSNFRLPSHLLTERQIAQRKATDNPMDKTEEEFTGLVNYYAQQRLTTGLVIFNDPISKYISEVARLLLKDDTALFNKLRFYVFKTPDVNAFTSATGNILITTGMLAQLDNEAQLAYVLAHEIIHYKQQHMLKGYRNREQLEEKTGNAPGYAWSRNYFQYQREHELESDAMGFDIYSTTNYRAGEALRVFDVLEYSELPFDDISFDTLWFNRGDMKVPGGYFRREVDPIYSDDNYEDRNSTHPNVRKRRMALLPSVDSIGEEGRQLYIISKENFLSMREKSRYEVCRLHLLMRDYPEAIYCAYMLLQKHPDDSWLRQVVGFSLYNITTYRQNVGNSNANYNPFESSYYSMNGGRYSRLTNGAFYRLPNWENIAGQQQQLFHAFSKLEPDELTVLSLGWNWSLFKEDTSNSFQRQLCDSLFSMLVFKQNLPRSYFSTISLDSAKSKLRQDSIQRALEIGEVGDSKYSKLDKFKLSSEKERFVKFAFVDLLKDSLFIERFNYYTAQRTSYVDKIEEPEWIRRKGLTKAQRKAEDKAEEESGYEIDKVLVIAPEYESYKQNKRKARELDQNYPDSELGQVEIGRLIQKTAKDQGVQTIVLSPFTMDSIGSDSFVDMAMLNEWFYERMRHGNNRYTLTLNNKRESDSIASKYGVRYIMFSSAETRKYKRIQRPVLYTVTCVIFPPALYRLFIPRINYQYESVVLDLKTGELIYLESMYKGKGNEKEKASDYYTKFFKKLKAKKIAKPVPTEKEPKP